MKYWLFYPFYWFYWGISALSAFSLISHFLFLILIFCPPTGNSISP